MSNGDHSVALAKIQQQLDSHEDLDDERFDSLRHEINIQTTAIAGIRDAVQRLDKKIAYFSGSIAVVIAAVEIGVRVIG
jgi:archaellum component FlaC